MSDNLFDIGMTVRLDRTIDRTKPCCSNIARIHPGKAQHAAELRCAECNSHRGWMPREALDFLTETTRRFGAPVEPLTLRDNQIGDHATIEKPKFDNSGLLFRNDNKVNDREPDYRGSLTIAGVEYRLSAWIKQGKESKFMSLAVTPKQVSATATKARAEFNDEIGF